ncbi:DUF938 domain-containing protein [Bdellovibrio sp. HCB2-146]|uniref:DUF938 domain-containing protein n=1 Tax=Bdellovibrio sp. HCB2-146 TaxID=3394362 RepID=UPI0039BD1C32
MEIPHSEAAERNKEPILRVLKEVIRPNHQRLLEIGAGTGQHAVYLAPFFPHLDWTPTEQAENLPMLKRRIEQARIPNITTPFKLRIGENDFPIRTFDIVLTINTFHIMHWKEVKTFIKLVSGRLQEGGLVVIYGPFNYGGKFTTPSNEAFDKTLKEKDPLSGLRGFEDVLKAFAKNEFELLKDYEMPSNNRMLVFSRLKFAKNKIPRR